MGHIVSKLFKTDLKTQNDKNEKFGTAELKHVTDVRSPSNEITRTPIFVERGKSDNHREYRPEHLKTKLLKNLKLDPRSPSVGIYRTPIVVEDSQSQSKPEGCDSPVSIYSCNMNSFLIQDVTTPVEPPANVSGFEITENFIDSDVILEPEQIIQEERKSKQLMVVDKPNTYEARRLLDELMSEEENFMKTLTMPAKKGKKGEAKTSEKKINEQKAKGRPPLSNITSCTNSPSQTNTGGKLSTKNKVLSGYGSENSPISKHMAQWDQNNTVVI